MGFRYGKPYSGRLEVKTTIEISDELLMRAKHAALERNTSLRAIVEEALERSLGAARQVATPLRTVTWGGGVITRGPRLDQDAVQAAIRNDRDASGSRDDAEWRARFGFVAPATSRD